MKFLHSMIRTKDEKKTLEFYCDFIGLKKGKRARLEDCYLQYLTDENTGVELELTINDDIKDYKNGETFGHFAFETLDIEETINKAKKYGYKVTLEPYLLKELNIKIAFVLDPDNNFVEFIQNL